MGRKEILDILQAAKEQTTILFSTHILSDVERICTDVAVLHDGKIVIHGPMSEVGRSRMAEGFIIELEKVEDVAKLLQNFEECHVEEEKKVVFTDHENNMFPVMEYLSKNRISVVRMERMEPTLESLFLEVVK